MSASSKKKLRKEQNAAALTEKQLAEQKESKKLKVYTISFVALLALVVVAALVVAGVTGFMGSGVLQRNNDAVTIGDTTLTNADLNFFYMDKIQSDYKEWNSSYGENMQLFVQWMQGLDITKPLNDQIRDEETGETFADYYKDLAINSAKNVYAIYNLAKAAGATLTEQQENELDVTIESMKLYASMSGYGNPTDYLKALYGPGATIENYRHYLEVNTVATNYAQSIYGDLEITDAEIDTRNKEKYDEFSTFDYSVFFVDVNDFLACNNEEVAADHKHSDEELANARKAAEEAAKELVASGATNTELLNAAISKIAAYKDNKNAKAADRLGYTPSQVSEKQAEWLKSADRKVGDLTMLSKETTTTDTEGKKTTTLDGYHIMIFLGRDDREQQLVNVRHILSSFKGGTTDENGNKVYTLAEKEGALDVLKAIQSDWQAAGGTVEAFEKLAKEKTDDVGTKENGGLCEDVYPGQMVTAFNDWCFEEGRKAGDYGIVETEFGHHLIYFVGYSDSTYRDMLIEETLRSEKYTEWYEEQLENTKVTELNTKYLSLDHVIAMQ